MVPGDQAETRVFDPVALHDHTPVGQLLHRPYCQPVPPIEEPALAVGQDLPQPWPVIDYPAVKREVLAAGDDLQRVELQIFHRMHRFLGTLLAAPAASGP